MSPEYLEIPIDQIVFSPFNTRGEVPEDELRSLAETIKRSGGNDVPIKVRHAYPDGKLSYEVVYGERRLRALKIAGIELARCIVEEMSDEEVLMQQWMENEEHKDISDYAKAQKIEQMMAAFKLNQRELAQKLGKNEGWVSHLLNMLKFEKLVPGQVLQKLTEKQARAILAAPPEVLEKLCADIEEQYRAEKTLPSATEITVMILDLTPIDLEEDKDKCDTCRHQVKAGVCDLDEGVECSHEKKEEDHEHVYDEGSTNCRICGRPLTAPESVKAGIGPVCATAPERFPGENEINQSLGIEPRPLTIEERAFQLLDAETAKWGPLTRVHMVSQLRTTGIYLPEADKLIAKYQKKATTKPETPYKLVEEREEPKAQGPVTFDVEILIRETSNEASPVTWSQKIPVTIKPGQALEILVDGDIVHGEKCPEEAITQ